MNAHFAGLSRAACVQLLRRYPLSTGILAGQWLHLNDHLQVLRQREQPLLHVDIMDGQFCPQFTVGPWAVEQLPQEWLKDAHLMVNNPFPVAQACVAAGAHCITLQAESPGNVHAVLHWLGEQTVPVDGGEMPVIRGISLSPGTPLETLVPLLDQVEVIQLLAVNPGYGSKLAVPVLKQRLADLLRLLGNAREHKLIAVDGALLLQDVAGLRANGIDRVVSGSALFRGNMLDKNLTDWLAVLTPG